jgi:hypothetical protein
LALVVIVWLLKSLTANEWKAVLVAVGLAVILYGVSLPSRRATAAARAGTPA